MEASFSMCGLLSDSFAVDSLFFESSPDFAESDLRRSMDSRRSFFFSVEK